MSMKEKKSIMSLLQVTSEESQKEENSTQSRSHTDTVESDDSCKVPNHKLSLEFRCKDTPPEQRELCESFWKAIDQHPELDRIIARGWSEQEVVTEKKSSKVKTPPPSHCDELQEFLHHNVDKLVLLGFKDLNNACFTKIKLNQSSANLLQDLQDFDRKVKTEISIPPKTPRPTRSEQDTTSHNSSTMEVLNKVKNIDEN